MEEEKERIISELNQVIKEYEEYLEEQIFKEHFFFYTKTIIINTILQKSLSIIDAFKFLLNNNNIIVLNSLMRMQIDNCIFIYAIFLLTNNQQDINDIYFDIVMKKKRLFDFKIDKNKMYDTYIVEKLNKIVPDFKELYEYCCKHIHYSEIATYLTIIPEKDYIANFNLSTDYKRFEKDCIITGDSFFNVSKLILILLKKFWKDIPRGEKMFDMLSETK